MEDLIKKIADIRQKVEGFSSNDQSEIEEFRIQMLSKKGIIPALFREFKNVSPDMKKEFGSRLNELKDFAFKRVNDLKEHVSDEKEQILDLDPSLPGDPVQFGSRHPVSIVSNHIINIFSRLGFVVSEGPEIEDDWHNFSALNFPPEHPARDMQDTFFIHKNPDVLLRTHTSSVQVHDMKNSTPPIRTISPGRVFRNEAISARAHCIFHQVEGLYIDEGVSFADLKQTLLFFAKEMFGKDTKIRLRPSFFPFTEPSAEMDISCSLCDGKGCNVCKYTGWLEILGCGMVDPNVLKNGDIDPEKYTGFAFGMGIERIALLRYGIKDIRLLFENDVRFLNQFQSAI
jgi:phenylalanyl-tRNA synthetase alpha chain